MNSNSDSYSDPEIPGSQTQTPPSPSNSNACGRSLFIKLGIVGIIVTIIVVSVLAVTGVFKSSTQYDTTSTQYDTTSTTTKHLNNYSDSFSAGYVNRNGSGSEGQTTDLTCDASESFSAGPNNKCGSEGQGGSECKSECCAVQGSHCESFFVCGWSLECRQNCLTERGCDLTCADFGTFSAGPNNKCGGEGQGGSECKSECCPAQKNYCIQNCNVADPNNCLVNCLDDRGCDFESTGLTCADFGTFSAGPNNKCGGDGQGGSECKSECCPAQKNVCIQRCNVADPNRCLVNCLDDRGCDFESTGLTCADFGTFSAGPNNKCGGDGQGGSECKSECCAVQGSHCESFFVCGWSADCRQNCLTDRGC